MAGYAVKACTDNGYRKRSMIAMGIVLVLSIAGLVLCIYNFIRASYLFALSYLLAIILGFTYVMIKYASVFTTYVAADRQSLFMRNWTNDFFPYDSDNKIRIISEFIPAKTVLTEAKIKDIALIAVGTKKFIKRYCLPRQEFLDRLDEIDKRPSKAKAVAGMELLYVETYSGDCRFMPIVNFSKRNVARLIQLVQSRNPNVEIKVNSRSYRRLLTKA